MGEFAFPMGMHEDLGKGLNVDSKFHSRMDSPVINAQLGISIDQGEQRHPHCMKAAVRIGRSLHVCVPVPSVYIS